MALRVKEEMNQLINLCKRMAFNCPVTHISDTFFTLMKVNRPKANYIAKLTN
jgi:hypothetical protein